MTANAPDAVAAQLAALIADAAAAVQGGRPDLVDAGGLRRMIAQLGTARSATAITALLAALGPALRARGVARRVLAELPSSVVAFLDAADEAFALDAVDVDVDLDRVAERLDRAASLVAGISTRRARDQALRDHIRREVSASIAQSMRAHGLAPAADLSGKDLDDPDDVDGVAAGGRPRAR